MTQQKWISVEDQLPESTRAVLVWNPENFCVFMAMWHRQDSEWSPWQGNNTEEMLPISHWMPLPEPPQ